PPEYGRACREQIPRNELLRLTCASDRVEGLQNDDPEPGQGEIERRDKAVMTSADHYDIGVTMLLFRGTEEGHRPTPRRSCVLDTPACRGQATAEPEALQRDTGAGSLTHRPQDPTRLRRRRSSLPRRVSRVAAIGQRP